MNFSGMVIAHRIQILALTTFAMLAFAGNSLLCRLALKNTGIDPASFTTIRLVSGAIALLLIVRLKHGKTGTEGGSWLSAFALFAYAAGFSFAYVDLSAATGALLLFGAVQATMISYGLSQGERIGGLSLLGLLIAVAGFVVLLLPGITAPPLVGSLLMLAAGIAWGIYSLRGKTEENPVKNTAGNFQRAALIAVVCNLFLLQSSHLDLRGVVYAICSGALTSGVGYAVWYTALPALKATTAAVVQLSVPAIAALGGVLLLYEPVNLRVGLASLAILGGIALFVSTKNLSRRD